MTSTHELPTQRLEEIASTVEIPESVTQTATQLYAQVYDNDAYYGRSEDLILATILYTATRVNGYAFNPDILATYFDINKNSMIKTMRYFTSEFDSLVLQPITPDSYIETACTELGVSDEFRDLAMEMNDVCSDSTTLLSGKSPNGFAAGIVYATTKLVDPNASVNGEDVQLTQKRVGEQFNVSQVTIRKRYQEQLEYFVENSSYSLE